VVHNPIIVQKSNTPKRNKNKKQQSQIYQPDNRRGMGPITEAYIRMICDPVGSLPVPAGFLTWSPSVMQSPYNRGTFLLTNDGFVVTVNPDASLAPSAAVSSILSNYVTIGQYNGASITSQVGVPAVNASTILAGTTTNRTCASGIKLMIEHPSTSQSGIIGLTRMNGITALNSLDAPRPSDFQSYPQTQIFCTNGGSATVRLNWLPSDAGDFQFAKNTVYTNGEGILNPLVISGSGFPAGTRIFYEVFTHLECQAGQQVLGSLASNADLAATSVQPALVDEHPTADSFFRRAAPVINQASHAMAYAVDKANMIDDAINTAVKVYHTVSAGAAKVYAVANKFANSRVGTALFKMV